MKTDQRDRAWRRANNYLCKGRDSPHHSTRWKKSKRWKQMYLRSEKIRRAQQLGFAYPVISRATYLQYVVQHLWNHLPDTNTL